MLIVHSLNDMPVRLTEERWRHMVDRHPEIDGQREKVLETVAGPDMIQRGDFEELLAVRRYTRTPMGEKCMIVVYREVNSEDGFILTAYLSRRPSFRRETLWKR